MLIEVAQRSFTAKDSKMGNQSRSESPIVVSGLVAAIVMIAALGPVFHWGNNLYTIGGEFQFYLVGSLQRAVHTEKVNVARQNVLEAQDWLEKNQCRNHPAFDVWKIALEENFWVELDVDQPLDRFRQKVLLSDNRLSGVEDLRVYLYFNITNLMIGLISFIWAVICIIFTLKHLILK